MKVQIDWDRARDVFDTLVRAFREKSYPYDRVFPPQIKENLPKSLVWGSEEHANFLFHSCYYMRGGIMSDEAFRRLTRMYGSVPEIFDPMIVGSDTSSWTEKAIEDILRSSSIGYYEQVSRFWIANARKLTRFWQGRPMSLFEEVDGYDDLCRLLIGGKRRDPEESHGFHGFQHKMVSMLVYFYVEAGLISPLSFPIPVDFHVLRLLTANRLLVVEGMETGINLFSDEYKEAARHLTQRYCEEEDVTPVELCEALWLLSRTSCVKNPGNASWIKGGRKARSTNVLPMSYEWVRGQAQQKARQRSCKLCLIQETCLYNVPSMVYYINGKLVVRGERISSVQTDLFPSEYYHKNITSP